MAKSIRVGNFIIIPTNALAANDVSFGGIYALSTDVVGIGIAGLAAYYVERRVGLEESR